MNLITASLDILLLLLFVRTVIIVLNKNWHKEYKVEDRVLFFYILWLLIATYLGARRFGFMAMLPGLRITFLPIFIYYIFKFESVNYSRLWKCIFISFIFAVLYETYQLLFGFLPWQQQYLDRVLNGGINTIYFSAQITGVEGYYKNISGYNLTYPVSMLFTISLVKIFEKTKFARKEILFSLVSFLFLIIVLERTPFFSIFLSGLIYYFIKNIKKTKIINILFLLFLAVSLYFMFTRFIVPRLPSYSFKYFRIIEMADPLNAVNMQSRILTHWAAAFAKMKSITIIWGYGLMYDPEFSIPVHQGLHSLYINQIIEFGVIGLALLLYFIYLIYKRSTEFGDKSKLILFSGIICFLIIGITNSPFAISSRYFFWMLAALISKDDSEHKLSYNKSI